MPRSEEGDRKLGPARFSSMRGPGPHDHSNRRVLLSNGGEDQEDPQGREPRPRLLQWDLWDHPGRLGLGQRVGLTIAIPPCLPLPWAVTLPMAPLA